MGRRSYLKQGLVLILGLLLLAYASSARDYDSNNPVDVFRFLIDALYDILDMGELEVSLTTTSTSMTTIVSTSSSSKATTTTIIMARVFTVPDKIIFSEKDTRNVTISGFKIIVQSEDLCYWKPVGLDDGFKVCPIIAEVITQNDVSVPVSKIKFFGEEGKIKNNDITVQKSVSRTPVAGGNEWYGWVDVGNKIDFQAGELTAVRFNFEIPKYEPMNYSISINGVVVWT